ncbi:MAG: MurR/RpiR family transcriptional regulator [Selenomonadaceae bacterium]|nr:MurR/RpiR family transcriptional regulator [Selenomonadaceae bacterium]
MTLEEVINEHKQILNPTDIAIWHFILNNRDQVRHISIHDLAKKCCVSSTTIVRFAQKLGFDGFSDLKSLLKREKLVDKVSSQDILLSLENFYSKTWTNLMKRNYDNASRLVHEANRVFAFASGYVQNNVVRELKRLFFYDNVFLYDIGGRDEFYSILKTANKDDLFIFVSLSGESHHVTEFSLQLQLKGIPLISITTLHDNTLASRSTENLYIFSEEFQVNSPEQIPFRSMFTYFLLVEIWYVNYRIYVKNHDDVQSQEKF